MDCETTSRKCCYWLYQVVSFMNAKLLSILKFNLPSPPELSGDFPMEWRNIRVAWLAGGRSNINMGTKVSEVYPFWKICQLPYL